MSHHLYICTNLITSGIWIQKNWHVQNSNSNKKLSSQKSTSRPFVDAWTERSSKTCLSVSTMQLHAKQPPSSSFQSKALLKYTYQYLYFLFVLETVNEQNLCILFMNDMENSYYNFTSWIVSGWACCCKLMKTNLEFFSILDRFDHKL